MASPEAERLIRKLRGMPRPPVTPIEARREAMEDAAKLFEVGDDVTCTAVTAGGQACEWIVPAGAGDQQTLIYFHGGGYCVGSIDSHRAMVAGIAAAAGARALMVDYRLGPEHPFPAGLDDAVSAYEWLLDEGTAADSIILGGDSAGGALALATMLRLRDSGMALPGGAVLISPWTDLTGSGESVTTCAEADPTLDAESLGEYARLYLEGASAEDPLASPVFADLSGLPPLLVQVGDSEILLDDSTRLAESARGRGVDVELEVWDDMFHVWHYYADWIPEARDAVAKIGEFVRARVPV